MEKFGHFILKDRWVAVLFAALFGLIPFTGWLSLVIVGLVTLRQGVKEGAWVLLASIIPVLVPLAFIGQPANESLGQSVLWLVLYNILYSNILLWVLASTLRLTSSWQAVVVTAVGVALVSVSAVHVFHADVVAWWHQYFVQLGESASSISAREREVYEQLLDSGRLHNLAQLTTGIIAAITVMMTGLYLAVARWWQALLFNPGGLRTELYTSRFGSKPFFIVLVCVFAAWMGLDIGWDLIPILALFYLFSGLTLIHCWAHYRLLQPYWFLIPFYVLLVLTGLYLMVSVIGLAIVDGFFDFRKRYNLLKDDAASVS